MSRKGRRGHKVIPVVAHDPMRFVTGGWVCKVCGDKVTTYYDRHLGHFNYRHARRWHKKPS